MSAETSASSPDVVETDEQPVDRPAGDAELTMTESIATAVGGMTLGGISIWFLAPICFNC